MIELEYIKDIVKKNFISIISITFGVISILGSVGFYIHFKNEYSKCPICEECSNNVVSEVSSEQEEIVSILKVDVKGAVKKPGVYEALSGSTVYDLITLAGGVTSKGVTSNLNLSKKVKDEMVIYVFTKAEIAEAKSSNEVVCEVPVCECEQIIVEECTDRNQTTEDSTKDSETSKKVSINTASIDELMTLTGIGEAKAKAIIEYREKNGPFKSIEEIMNISGIKESAFEKIKDDIEI